MKPLFRTPPCFWEIFHPLERIGIKLIDEQSTLRKQALTTQEVANAAVFLLSERASGINAQGIVLDAGMSVNYFDKDIVRKAQRPG